MATDDAGPPVGPLGLRVGQRARRTRTVTARDVELYAELTGDRNPLHFDADFAARTRFGRLVALGGITAGMLNALVATDLPGPGTVFMSQSLRYLAPTYLGDTLTAEVEVLSLKAGKPVCQLRATIVNQDARPCSRASAGRTRSAPPTRAPSPTPIRGELEQFTREVLRALFGEPGFSPAGVTWPAATAGQHRRPPLALDRLTESPGGQLLHQFRRAWSDGSTALLLDPLEPLERLAALVPPPRRPLVAYHGVLAPDAPRARPAPVLCAGPAGLSGAGYRPHRRDLASPLPGLSAPRNTLPMGPVTASRHAVSVRGSWWVLGLDTAVAAAHDHRRGGSSAAGRPQRSLRRGPMSPSCDGRAGARRRGPSRSVRGRGAWEASG
jgi:acyl dehydratase